MCLAVTFEVETIQAAEFEVAESAGVGGECPIAVVDHVGAHLGIDLMIHFSLNVVGHKH